VDGLNYIKGVSMDISKHIDVFNPAKVEGKVLIIGIGAVGNTLAMEIAKLGVKDICLMDGDVVEAHNLANQFFYKPENIGWPKVHTMKGRIHEYVGIEVKTKQDFYKGQGKLEFEYVFVCVDSMSSRSIIFEKGIFANGKTKFLCDGRMSPYTYMVHAHCPLDIKQVAEYRDTLYKDSEVKEHRAVCGTVLSIGATAHMVAATMTWLFIQEVMGTRTTTEITQSIIPWKTLSSY